MLCWRTLHADSFSKRTLKGHPVVAVREERRSPHQMPKRVKGRSELIGETREAANEFGAEAEGSLSAISFPSGYCSAVRGVAGSLLVLVSTVPVMIPLMVRRSASTATTLYFSLKNPVSLHPIAILMRNLRTVFPPMFRAKLPYYKPRTGKYRSEYSV